MRLRFKVGIQLKVELGLRSRLDWNPVNVECGIKVEVELGCRLKGGLGSDQGRLGSSLRFNLGSSRGGVGSLDRRLR